MSILTPQRLRIALHAATKRSAHGDLDGALGVLELLGNFVEADDYATCVDLMTHRSSFLHRHGRNEEALGAIDDAWQIVRRHELKHHGVQVNRLRKEITAAMEDDSTVTALAAMMPSPRNRRA